MDYKYDFTGNRVLIVEDIKMLREIEAKRLKIIGFEVDLATNGKEAVDLYESHPAWYYQTILMDIIMPVMDGREASKLIRSSDKEDALCIPIISISSDNSEEAMSISFEAGIDQFISKPIDFPELINRLSSTVKNTRILIECKNVKDNVESNSRYDKLWKMLIDRKMTKTDLRKMCNFSTVTLAKISKGVKISPIILKKISQKLNCSIEDIVDIDEKY